MKSNAIANFWPKLRRVGMGGAVSLLLLPLAGLGWADQPAHPVIVTNPADIAKAEGVQHPYQASTLCTFVGNICLINVTTPSNQRLVIEYASGNCGLNAGVFVQTLLIEEAGLAPQFLSPPYPIVGASFTSFGQSTRIYIDGNVQLTFEAVSTSANDGRACRFSVSGQSIDVP
jgi:hypothetical protein